MKAILDLKKPNLFDIREEILQAQRGAAKNPNHLVNDRLMAFFEKRKRLIESRKNDNNQ